MGQDETKQIGAVTWRDLAVDDAKKVADFYRRVVGWESSEQDMGGIAISI